jgi:hypothetical protein
MLLAMRRAPSCVSIGFRLFAMLLAEAKALERETAPEIRATGAVSQFAVYAALE